jgi:hypothetical protein
MSTVAWPQGHEPQGAAIHEVNTGHSTASVQDVWAWLVKPTRWQSYYSNARHVRHLGGSWPDIELGTRFSWVTFGARVTTEVTEFEPFERLAWTGTGLGSRGHHAWILSSEADGGTLIHTEETQRGSLVKVLRPIHAPRMHRAHQMWVDNLSHIAATVEVP